LFLQFDADASPPGFTVRTSICQARQGWYMETSAELVIMVNPHRQALLRLLTKLAKVKPVDTNLITFLLKPNSMDGTSKMKERK
jgi:hypothetical protein